MIVLSDTADAQTWTVIPRFEPSTSVTVTMWSEGRNVQTHSATITGTFSNGILTLSTAFNPVLTLNEFYYMEVKQSTTLAWAGKVFVTDQTDFDSFTTQDGKFTEYPSNNNEFIFV